MTTEETPPSNVIPFRRRKTEAKKPAVKTVSNVPVPTTGPKPPPTNVGNLIAPPNFPQYPLSLEELLEGLREELLRITQGGVGRGLPQDATALELVFHGMFMAWAYGKHCCDVSTGTVTIVLESEVVTQIEQLMTAAGYRLNYAVITKGLRIKPSYVNLIPIEAAAEPEREPDPEPEPEPPMVA